MNIPEPVTASVLLNTKPLNTGIIPVYPLTEGLTYKVLSKAINNALSQYLHGIENDLPDELIKERNLLSKQDAIKNIHHPKNLEQAENARKTLAYEELYHLQYLDYFHFHYSN
mgnify:FL=1